jgi:hypothetical protein
VDPRADFRLAQGRKRTSSACRSKAGDSIASHIMHEIFEAITDPPNNGLDQDGWRDSEGYEAADKCAWYFGTDDDIYLVGSGGALANTHLGNRDYLLQAIWVVTPDIYPQATSTWVYRRGMTTQGCGLAGPVPRPEVKNTTSVINSLMIK